MDEEGAAPPPMPKPAATSADALDLSKVTDPQLDRACDILRGVLVFERR